MEQSYYAKSTIQLGKTLGYFSDRQDWPGYDCGINREEFDETNRLISELRIYNGWFTEPNVRLAIGGIAKMLQADMVNEWLSSYHPNGSSKTIAIIMAGNIPAVGFHDLLCVLLAGHKAQAKLSGDDNKLLPHLIGILNKIAPEISERIEFIDGKLESFDAVLATGSNNTSRHFEHYFSSYPNIIRKNRNSIAILNGNETDGELSGLAHDVFDYFGLGCRNVTKLYFPTGFDKDRLFNAFYPFNNVLNNNKYANNYDYHKALFLMNNEEVLENGFLLLKSDCAIASPVGTLYYEEYDNEHQLRNDLTHRMNEVQCVVSQTDIPFGQAQIPKLWDYADGVDTMQFLCEL